LCNTDDKLKKERTYLEILRGKRVDGLILGTAHIKDKSILELEKKKFPYILVSRNIEGLDKNCIIVDDVEGGLMATEYLIKLGHRRIAHITGPLKIRSALNRLKGYKLALKKYGIEYRDELVGEGDFRIKGGYQVMKKFLKLAEPPTAIFAANDLLALGAMQAPEDFSVIGFNDIELASFVYPALTTIRQPMLEMGALAVKMLIKIIEEGEFNQRKILLKSKLITRESCKKINRK
jgi:LacI family repressor for deo operon, udp, cdd, tsx, nupC, and nupG